MRSLQLHMEEVLQGQFELGPLNLMLVFQPNCPGCFSHAVPIFKHLYEQAAYKELTFLALSTAFEDFSLNTKESTQLLLDGGQLVGETQKAFEQAGYTELPYPIPFPVAMDKRVKQLDNQEEVVDQICAKNPNYDIWPEFEKEAMRQHVGNYLKSLPYISLTFVLNQFKGTPTFVLFDKQYNILEHWFGHKEFEAVDQLLSHHLSGIPDQSA